jgi:tripartite-type tricarboxylate transporter receptor subunit TctC
MEKFARFALAAAVALVPGLTLAQTYPNKSVRLIVPFPAGGPADLFGRGLAQGMSAQLGQPVVIENRAGAGGVIGVDAVAKAAPDGYTLGLNSASSVAIAPFSFDKMPYDPRKDLALISLVVNVPEVLIVHPSVPAKNLEELIAYARKNPNKINFGSAGAGSITHLAVELLKAEAKIELVHVPYKGAAPAVTDLLGGQVQMAILDVPVVLQHIRSGKLRAIVTASGRRASTLPEVPSTVEANYPKVNSDNWYGLVAPSATPADIQRRIHAAAMVALRSAEVIEQFAKVSGVAMPSTPEEYSAYLTAEQAKWGAVVKAIGFRATE